MHVPTGAIVARSIDLHPPLLHLYAVKSEARIATCPFVGGLTWLLHPPAQRLVLFVQPFYFIFAASLFFLFV